jgi:hypothetical protein
MSTYRATIRVEEGMLHTARPLTAPDVVTTMIDSVVYDVREGGGGEIISAEITVETATDSGTPLGDSIAATSSAPVNGGTGQHTADEPTVPDELQAPALAPVTATTVP